MSLNEQTDLDTPPSLPERYAALHTEMLQQYERYVAVGNHWLVYAFLAWEHLLPCVLSYYLLEVLKIESPWPYAFVWLGQVAVALAAITLARVWTPVDRSPLQRHVDRTWTVFLLLCWSVAILNVMANQKMFVFLPVLATLSSFAFLVLTSFLSRRFLMAALILCLTGALMARHPTYGFLIYGAGWLLVLQVIGIIYFRKRKRWQAPVVRPSEAPPPPANGHATVRPPALAARELPS